jgi:aspartyl protease family protein
MRVLLFGLIFGVVFLGWQAGAPRQPAAPAVQDGQWQARSSNGSLQIERGWQGHFFVNADVAGEPVRFVVDTGATTVALGRIDARRLGLSIPDSAFNLEMGTASGTIRGAAVTLPRLRIGDIQLLEVRAVVLDIPETMPLLGQSFLSRLDRVSIEGDKMTLSKG